MNVIKSIEKLLKSQCAQLVVVPYGDAHEIVLRVPACVDAAGNTLRYATDSMLGTQFPPLPQPVLNLAANPVVTVTGE